MPREWRDQWALVTGAIAGIGVALAKKLGAVGTVAGKSDVISRTGNYFEIPMQRPVPGGLVTSIAAKMFRPKKKP